LLRLPLQTARSTSSHIEKTLDTNESFWETKCMDAIERAKERVHWIAAEARKGDWDSYENRLAELIIDYESRLEELSRNTPKNQDIALLVQEMRTGFETMDKRFDDLIHQLDKRFEQMDKRFELLTSQMDKRFNSIQWFMGLGFTIFAVIIGYGTFFKQ